MKSIMRRRTTESRLRRSRSARSVYLIVHTDEPADFVGGKCLARGLGLGRADYVILGIFNEPLNRLAHVKVLGSSGLPGQPCEAFVESHGDADNSGDRLARTLALCMGCFSQASRRLSPLSPCH